MLLADIQAIFAASPHVERYASADLIERLIEDPARPWAEYSRGKPITQAKLARILSAKGVGITTVRARIGNENVRVYEPKHFQDAFTRFVSQKGDFKVEQRNSADNTGTSATFQSGTSDPMFHFENSEKPNNDGDFSTVPLSKGKFGDEGVSLDDAALGTLAARYLNTAFDAADRVRSRTSMNDAAADLRRDLAAMVPPERVQTEFDRVLYIVATVPDPGPKPDK
jgi:hypothetical protein